MQAAMPCNPFAHVRLNRAQDRTPQLVTKEIQVPLTGKGERHQRPKLWIPGIYSLIRHSLPMCDRMLRRYGFPLDAHLRVFFWGDRATS